MSIPSHPSLITIGLPVRNGEKHLEETLLSLVSQNYPRFEIIISDNASNSETKAILARFEVNYPQVKVYTQTETLPILENFAFVLSKATGEYFCWAAHDDLRTPQSLRAQAEVLDRHPDIVCVMTDVVNFYEDSSEPLPDRLEGIRLEKVLRAWKQVRKHFFSVPISNVYFCIYGLFRTEVIRGVDLEVGMDFITNVEIPILAQVAALGPIASIELDGFRYRRHSQSFYHQEVAGEGPEVQIHRNKVIRRLLRKTILTSRLPVSEKAFLLLNQIAEWRKDRRSEKERLAGPKRRKKKMKRKKARHKFLRKLRNRLRNRIFGAPPSQPKKKRKVRDQEEVRVSIPDEELALARVDPETSTYNGFVRRETARRRLEAKGWRFGLDKSMGLLFDHGIASVIDCGANCGQFIEMLRESGWSGQVHSFEPLPGAYEILKEKSSAVDGWLAFPFALGESRSEAEIKVAGNSYSSSLLEFTADFEALLPDACPTRTETIQVRRLDEFIEEERLAFTGPILLKLDVQGFELQVMNGAGDFLEQVHLVQTEMAFIPSYRDAPVFADVKKFLNDRGFVLVHLIDGHVNHLTGELREVDGIFVNTNLLKAPEPPSAEEVRSIDSET